MVDYVFHVNPFPPAVTDAAGIHAIAQYPEEACGIVADDKYVPLPNVALDPKQGFELPPTTLRDYSPQAVIHSHCRPQHGPEPSADDMQNQITTGIPFYGIVWTDGVTAGPPLWFGDFLLEEPLLGREFTHGVRDCYSLIRGWYWQERGIKLKEFPRSLNWWKEEDKDLYRDGFQSAGFTEVDPSWCVGDVLLMQIRERVPHHAAILVNANLIMHHLPSRLSRREPLLPWSKYIVKHLRYGGGDAA